MCTMYVLILRNSLFCICRSSDCLDACITTSYGMQLSASPLATQSMASSYDKLSYLLKVHKIENFFDSNFGICNISLIVMSKY
jgi:hypothetical protein